MKSLHQSVPGKYKAHSFSQDSLNEKMKAEKQDTVVCMKSQILNLSFHSMTIFQFSNAVPFHSSSFQDMKSYTTCFSSHLNGFCLKKDYLSTLYPFSETHTSFSDCYKVSSTPIHY